MSLFDFAVVMSKPASNREIKVEICANSIQSAINAEAGGAHRIELCENLEAGGTTPSYGTIKATIAKISLPVHVLIRPRPGGFCYTDDELEIMKHDIQVAKELGAEGVVLGVLSREGTVDVLRTRELVLLAKQKPNGLGVTFHRSFDEVAGDPVTTLEDVISTGCNRLLTSGMHATAEEGISMLKKLKEKSGGRMAIMPGRGVTPGNAPTILNATELTEIHASAASQIVGSEIGLSAMGSTPVTTRAETVKAIVDAIEEHCSFTV